jgi:hypothetical protein
MQQRRPQGESHVSCLPNRLQAASFLCNVPMVNECTVQVKSTNRYEGWMTYNGKDVVSALHLLEKPKESDAVDAVDAMCHDEPRSGHTGPGSKQQQEAFERSRLDRVR